MKIRIRRAVAVVIVTVALAVTALGSVLATGASAATVTPPTAQMVKTCEAYRAWYYSRTTAHVNAIVAATFTGDWTPTGARHILRDATRLYADVRDDSAYRYIAAAIVAFGTDCNKYVLPWER